MQLISSYKLDTSKLNEIINYFRTDVIQSIKLKYIIILFVDFILYFFYSQKKIIFTEIQCNNLIECLINKMNNTIQKSFNIYLKLNFYFNDDNFDDNKKWKKKKLVDFYFVNTLLIFKITEFAIKNNFKFYDLKLQIFNNINRLKKTNINFDYVIIVDKLFTNVDINILNIYFCIVIYIVLSNADYEKNSNFKTIKDYWFNTIINIYSSPEYMSSKYKYINLILKLLFNLKDIDIANLGNDIKKNSEYLKSFNNEENIWNEIIPSIGYINETAKISVARKKPNNHYKNFIINEKKFNV